MRKTLDEIGLEAGTDKSSRYHDFLSWYEKTLGKWRDDQFVMLEIGVALGESLRTFGEYFNNASIIGLDINQDALLYKVLQNTHVKIGDAGRLEVLTEIFSEFGRPRIIIDDGSHLWHHQIEALRYGWPQLAPGGIFIMEDLHTSFPALADEYKGSSIISGYDYILELNKWVVGNRFMADRVPYDGFITTYWPTVESISWYRGTCIIQKR